MDISKLCICDLACRKFTSRSIPTLVLALISKQVLVLEKKMPKKHSNKDRNEHDHDLVLKGARRDKKDRHKQIVTKHRIRRAFRWY